MQILDTIKVTIADEYGIAEISYSTYDNQNLSVRCQQLGLLLTVNNLTCKLSHYVRRDERTLSDERRGNYRYDVDGVVIAITKGQGNIGQYNMLEAVVFVTII